MNIQAIFSSQSPDYLIPFQPETGDTVKVRLRTRKEDRIQCVLVIDDGQEEKRIPMTADLTLKTDQLFLWYAAEFRLGREPLHYYFEITANDLRADGPGDLQQTSSELTGDLDLKRCFITEEGDFLQRQRPGRQQTNSKRAQRWRVRQRVACSKRAQRWQATRRTSKRAQRWQATPEAANPGRPTCLRSSRGCRCLCGRPAASCIRFSWTVSATETGLMMS